MNTQLEIKRPFSSDIPPEIRADAQAVIDSLMTGQPLDPEVARRVRERSKAMAAETFAKHGLLDIGVPIIRELPGELPE